MKLVLSIAVRALVIGLIVASVSMMTSLWNGVGFIGGWTLALAVLLVAFTIVFIVLMKQSWDEYFWMKANGYDITRLSREDYFYAMQKMEDDQSQK